MSPGAESKGGSPTSDRFERSIELVVALGSIVGILFSGMTAFYAVLSIVTISGLLAFIFFPWPYRSWKHSPLSARARTFRDLIQFSHTAVPWALAAIAGTFIIAGLASRHLAPLVASETRAFVLREQIGTTPGPIRVSLPSELSTLAKDGKATSPDSTFLLFAAGDSASVESFRSVLTELTDRIAVGMGNIALVLLLCLTFYGCILLLAEAVGGETYHLTPDPPAVPEPEGDT